MTVPAAVAGSDNSANAVFIEWVERSDVIHIFGFDDEGRAGHGPALVSGMSPVYFGYEWVDPTVEALQAILDNPDHDIRVSIDGGVEMSLKHLYQTPFVAVPGEGPEWSWDHAGDGLGNNNGIANDWSGPVMFWRYSVKHLDKGTHTFVFKLVYPGPDYDTDTITVEVG
jgi:hypothetical protein